MFGRYGVICALCDKYNGFTCDIDNKVVWPLSFCHINKSYVLMPCNLDDRRTCGISIRHIFVDKYPMATMVVGG